MNKMTILSCFAGMWLLLLTSCSSGDEEDQSSVIDEAVQKTADKAVAYIKEPIDKAEAVKELEEERARSRTEQLQ